MLNSKMVARTVRLQSIGSWNAIIQKWTFGVGVCDHGAAKLNQEMEVHSVLDDLIFKLPLCTCTTVMQTSSL
jgi:hypothetical protein